jgi:hypothetical protein
VSRQALPRALLELCLGLTPPFHLQTRWTIDTRYYTADLELKVGVALHLLSALFLAV